MSLFFILLSSVLPLGLLVAIGYLAGRLAHIDQKQIAAVLFYAVTPLVLFRGAVLTRLSAGAFLLPAFTYGLCLLMSLIFYGVSKRIWSDHRRNAVAVAAATGNFGYFGLPVAMAAFGPEIEGPYILALLGPMLFLQTAGYFLAARGRHGTRESLKHCLRLPSVYAFVLGVALNLSGVRLPQAVLDVTAESRGAWSVLGMMVIGLSLAPLTKFRIDWPITGVVCAAKFVGWPIVVLLVLSADAMLLHLLNPVVHRILLVYAAVPLAATAVVLAAMFDIHEDKIATATLVSTVLALGLTPAVIALGTALL